MAKLQIGDKQIEVGDEFLQLSPEEQQTTVARIASEIGAGPAAPKVKEKPAYEDIGQGRAEGTNFLRGIPIAGAYADKAAAALNAAAQPVMETGLSKAPSFGERYTENEARIKKGTDAYNRENPVSSMAQQFAGGTAAFAPLAASSVAARALGMSGTLPQMVGRGAASGAAIGGADALARGEDPIKAATVSGAAGAGLPIIGRGIGKAVQAIRGTETLPRPMPKTSVVGVEVPQFESSRTGDNAAGSIEQAALSGSMGPGPQRLAQQEFAKRDAAMGQARANFGAQLSPETDPRLSPAGSPPPIPPEPHAAGNQMVDELAARQAEEMRRGSLAGVAREASDFQLRNELAPQPGLPATALEASQIVGGRIGTAAREAAEARTGAYRSAGEIEGAYDPAAFQNVSRSLTQRLNAGAPEQRVRVNAMTPRTAEALQVIENEIGSGRTPTNQAAGAMQIGPDGRPVPPPITGRDVEAVRQQLVPLMRDANNAARAPGGSASDARGMRRLMEAFDQHVRDVVRAGGFSGNGPELLRRMDAARAAHSAYRGTFSARGQGDVVGPVIEKIIGKHPGQELQPDAIASSLYGSPAAPGGGNTVALAQRARQILGPDSQEWGAAKQGYLSHILDRPEGTTPLTPLEQAERIYSAVNGKGAALTQTYLTPDEIGRLTAHADMLRRLFPNRTLDAVDRQIMRLSGADGHPPASSRDAIQSLINPSSGVPNAMADKLAARLKQTLSPESWDGVRQMTWKALTDRPEGVTEFGAQALSTRISKFLDEPLARVMFDDRERQLMRIIQQEYQKQIPLPNTTNPSGSGVLATKMVKAAQGNLLPMLGLATNGPMGVIGGFAAEKGLSFLSTRKAMEQTKDVFFGKAPKGAKAKLSTNYERAAAILAKAAQPLIAPAPSGQGSR